MMQVDQARSVHVTPQRSKSMGLFLFDAVNGLGVVGPEFGPDGALSAVGATAPGAGVGVNVGVEAVGVGDEVTFAGAVEPLWARYEEHRHRADVLFGVSSPNGVRDVAIVGERG